MQITHDVDRTLLDISLNILGFRPHKPLPKKKKKTVKSKLFYFNETNSFCLVQLHEISKMSTKSIQRNRSNLVSKKRMDIKRLSGEKKTKTNHLINDMNIICQQKKIFFVHRPHINHRLMKIITPRQKYHIRFSFFSTLGLIQHETQNSLIEFSNKVSG